MNMNNKFPYYLIHFIPRDDQLLSFSETEGQSFRPTLSN